MTQLTIVVYFKNGVYTAANILGVRPNMRFEGEVFAMSIELGGGLATTLNRRELERRVRQEARRRRISFVKGLDEPNPAG